MSLIVSVIAGLLNCPIAPPLTVEVPDPVAWLPLIVEEAIASCPLLSMAPPATLPVPPIGGVAIAVLPLSVERSIVSAPRFMIAPAEAPFCAVAPLARTVFPTMRLFNTSSDEPPVFSTAPPSAKLLAPALVAAAVLPETVTESSVSTPELWIAPPWAPQEAPHLP